MTQVISTKPYWFSEDFKLRPRKSRCRKHSNYVDISNKQLELKYSELKKNKAMILIKEKNQ